MKPYLSLFLCLGLLLFSACKKEDFNRPEIKLQGEEILESVLNQNYNDAGATAFDKEEGDISHKIIVSNPVNKDYASNYQVKFNVSDKAGNSADEVTRTVTIRNSASEGFDGIYSVLISTVGQNPYSYSEEIKASKTLNWRIDFSKFGDYPNASSNISADINGNLIEIPLQNITTGSNPVQRSITGSGQVSFDPSTGNPTITLTITETVDGQSTDYTYYYAML